MRFGIMAMQVNALIPSGLPLEGLLSHMGRFNNGDLVLELAGNGFNLIELGGDLVLFLPHVFSTSAIERLAEVKQERGLAYTVHLPLWSVEPSTPLAPVREGSVRALVNMIQATLPLNPEVYVLHATGDLAAEFYHMGLPELAHGMLLRQFQSYARQSIQTMLGETGIPSRQLAIETVEFPFELTLDLAEELDLSICFDTGHILSGFAGPLDLFTALQRCLPRLAEVHLHDSPWLEPGKEIIYGKDHRPLGSGDLRLGDFLDTLASANFNGPLIFELRVEEALASIETIRATRPGYLTAE